MAATQCKSCSGLGRVESKKTGIVQECPLCGGSGQETNYIYMPRTYLLSASALILATTVQSIGQMSIDAIAPFQAVNLVATREGTFTTELQDQSGRDWQNAPVNDANLWGTAQNPFPLLAPLTIPAKAILRWKFVSTSGAQTNEIQPCILGFDLYEG